MTILTPGQIAAVSRKAGCTGDNLVISIAICMAESGGQVEVVSRPNTNGTVDRGLWQINSVHSEYDQQKLLAADYNAAAMFTLSSKGTVWTPWSTYNDGTYQKNMATARGAAAGGGGGGGGSGPKPWYCFSRIDGLGGVEPFGNYP